MEKYGTFEVYENKKTGEIQEVPLHDEDTLVKLASDKNWKHILKQKKTQGNSHELFS